MTLRFGLASWSELLIVTVLCPPKRGSSQLCYGSVSGPGARDVGVSCPNAAICGLALLACTLTEATLR